MGALVSVYGMPASIVSTLITDVVEALIIDLLDWVGGKERTYEEVMDAWRTSCPRLPVWEDANDRGLLAIKVMDGRSLVRLTPSGAALLESRARPNACDKH